MSIDTNTSVPQGCLKPALCPLNRVPHGRAFRVRELRTSADVAQRLREVGLVELQEGRLLKAGDGLVCRVCNSRLAISAELAESILVEPLPAPGGIPCATTGHA